MSARSSADATETETSRPDLDERADSDVTMLEIIVAVGPATSPVLGDALESKSEFAAATASNALERLSADGLIETTANIHNPNAPLWTLTERGEALVRNGGDQ